MPAKEERAMHLEMHRMNRASAEMMSKIRALEAECAQLRSVIKHETEKQAATVDAATNQCRTHQDAMERMKQECAVAMARMEEAHQRAQQEAEAQLKQDMLHQRQSIFDETVVVKRQLNEQYAGFVANKTKELDALKHALTRAREEEIAAEKKARKQCEEKHLVQFLSRMEELDKLKAETAQKLEDAKRRAEEAKRRAEEDHAQQLAARDQREEELKRQCRLRMDEANRLNAETVQKLEDAKRRAEEDHAQQLAADKAKLDAQVQKCAALKDALVRCNQERTELTTLAETKFEDYVKTHTSQVIKTVSALQICKAVAANYAHMRMVCADLDFNGKRVFIYSHYSKQDTVDKYNYLTLEKMQHWFDYVIVLTNCPNQWQFESPNYRKCHLMWYNLKSDFRNYGVFIAQAGQRLMGASQLCFANDSFVVVDVLAFDRCMARMFDSDALSSHDFMGITSSYENVYHLQSYFMCFNARTLDAVIGYFNTHGLPINHHDAISVYELGITKHLVARGFKPFAMVSNQEMPVPLNTTCFKWSAVLQNTGIIKRQHLLKQYPPRFAMTDLNIELVATKFAENKPFVQFLHERGITQECKPGTGTGMKPEYKNKNKLYYMN
jgi:hypothetical protein